MAACLILVLAALVAAAASAASPAAAVQCSATHGNDVRILDLTVPVRSGMPAWTRESGLLRNWRALSQSQDEGDIVYQSHLNLDAHTGTHFDAPRHFLKGGDTIDKLPLAALVGPAHVVDVPPNVNVTAAALGALSDDVPPDAERLLFRTANTRRGLMARTAFASDYVGLDSTAARWLAEERPGVRLVGIDYLSIGQMDDIAEAHRALFRKGTVVVEGLNLSAAPSGGPHHLTCLPLLLVGSDGAPARCILQTAAPGPSR